jgi:hypothetical protein
LSQTTACHISRETGFRAKVKVVGMCSQFNK